MIDQIYSFSIMTWKGDFCAYRGIFQGCKRGWQGGSGPSWPGEPVVQGHVRQSHSLPWPPWQIPSSRGPRSPRCLPSEQLRFANYSLERGWLMLRSKGASSRRGCEGFGSSLVLESGRPGAGWASPFQRTLSLQAHLLAWEWAALLLGGGELLKDFYFFFMICIEPLL